MLGAHPGPDGITFRLWTTTATRCAVHLFAPDGRVAIRTAPLAPEGHGCFAATLPVGPAVRYAFVLDGELVRDPYARHLPDGIDGPAALDPAAHPWRHRPVARPLREHVIYELHVGTFTPEGTFTAAAARLAELAELGVTAIELMPVAAFAGHHGWGYDGVAHFAPHAAYGSPDELRALVDAAHGLDLAVLLDVVYNHLGPAGNVLGRYSPTCLTREVATPWGDAPDFRSPAMRRYAIDSALHWLEAYRLDGLRLDAVHAFAAPGEPHVIAELVAAVRALERPVLVIAEDDRRDPAALAALGVDGVWADDLHHAVHATLTGEQDGYYQGFRPRPETIAAVIERGWLGATPPDPRTAEALITCVQNHDQIGNRALGDRLHATTGLDRFSAATMLLLFLPTTPLLFMGQEWAASTPFLYFTDHDPALGQQIARGRCDEFARFRAFADPVARAAIPDPQAPATFAASILRRDERDRPPHDRIHALHRDLLRLRREDPVLRGAPREALAAEVLDGVLVVRRWLGDDVRRLHVNLGTDPRPLRLAGQVLYAWPGPVPGALPPGGAILEASVSGAGG